MIKKHIKDFLKVIDQFGNSIQIHINGKMKYNTSLGGVLSLTLFAVLIYFTMYFGSDMVFKTNPSLINYKSYKISNDTVINNTNFFLAFQAVTSSGQRIFFDKKYYDIDIYTQEMNNVFANTGNLTKIEVNRTACQNDYLKDFSVEKKIKDTIMANYDCFALNNLILTGSPFHNLASNTLRLTITYNYDKLVADYNSTCAKLGLSISTYGDLCFYAIKMFPLDFRMFYQSYSYDPDNYSNPFKKELAFADVSLVRNSITQVYASFISGKSTRDDGMLFATKNITDLYGFNDFKVITIGSIYDPTSQFQALFKLYLYMDYYNDIFIRSYPKLQDVGAQVGAILKVAYFAFQFCIFFYSFNRINEQLAYKFFRFTPEKNIKPFYEFEDNQRNEEVERNQSQDRSRVMNGASGYTSRSFHPLQNPNISGSRDGLNPSTSLNPIKDNPKGLKGDNKIVTETLSIPKIFLNSIFTSDINNNDDIKGKVEQLQKKSLQSLNQNFRKMAMKFNFGGGGLGILAKRRSARRSVTRSKSKKVGFSDQKIFNDKKDFNADPLNMNKDFNCNEEKDFNIKLVNAEKDKSFSNDEGEIRPTPSNVMEKNTPTLRDIEMVGHNPRKPPHFSNTKVIESSLRVTNNVHIGPSRGRRVSYKINNDKGYIMEGEEDDVKIHTVQAIKNFNQQDMIKTAEKLGFFDKFKGKICCKKNISSELKTKLEFYEKAGFIIKEKIDIIHFLNIFDEFQKFRILFLNPYQNLALRYSKKANIFNINFNNVIDFYERFCNTNDHTANIKKVMDYFVEKIKSKTLDVMDQKLMELLDGDLKKAILMKV